MRSSLVVKSGLLLYGLTLLFFALFSPTLLAANAPSQVELPQGKSLIAMEGADRGKVAPETPINIAVVLSLRNQKSLDELIAAQNTPGSPSYHKFLTSAQFLSLYGPAAPDYNSVKSFLTANGFTIKKDSGGQVISASGTAAQAESAFKTEIHQYEVRGKQEFANQSAPRVPAGLAGIVKSVQGLDSTRLHTDFTARPAGTAAPAQASGPPYTPAQISTAYDYPNRHGYSGGGRTIAVATFADYSDTDIQVFENKFGYQPAGLSRIPVDSNPGITSDSVETTMDIEWSTSLAPGANELVYMAPNSGSGWTDELNRIVTDNTADVVTLSWGGCENSSVASQEDGIFKQGAAEGQTWLNASGDSGSNCGAGSAFGVNYPASSPYVTAMGGTSLYLDGSDNISSESAWGGYDLTTGNPFGSGGGTSTFEPLPSWEYGSSYFANGYRWTSDMAMDGNPGTGMYVYYGSATTGGGNWLMAAGTSIDAPFASALAAEIVQAGNRRLGLLAARINQLANSSNYATVFHDITSGSNGDYAAGTGWDPPTGWGSPDGYQMLLKYYPPPPTVSNVQPTGIISGSATTVSASYSDNSGTGINTSSVVVKLDGNTLIGCTVTATSVSCPATALSIGTHFISGQVKDNAGNTSQITGSFAVSSAPAKNYFWTWYDNVGGDNWVLLANPSAATSDEYFSLRVGGGFSSLTGYNNGVVAPGASIEPVLPGTVGGPVEASSLTGDPAITSQRALWPRGGSSLEEVPGTLESNLSSDYYWTWYDQTSGRLDWVMVANPSTSAVYYQVDIAKGCEANPQVSNQCATGELAATGDPAGNDKVEKQFDGVITGPVEVRGCSLAFVSGSCPGASENLIASQRVLSNGGSAFNEVPGTPASELSSDYLWTWYDQTGGNLDWVMISNPNPAPVSATVTFTDQYGAKQTQTRSIAAGSNWTPQFDGKIGGPVEVTSTGGNVIASQRSLIGPSFEEVPGYPRSALASSYNWTWYDQNSPGSLNWVMVSNPSATTVSATVSFKNFDGTPVTRTSPILPGGNWNPDFPGKMGGPVNVTSTGGPVLASQRVLWNGYFNEVLGQ
ncbi:MAG: protease pro-enzyme activation domain-containing protein [Actinobacteria bacterium]|nr:protease pro-enzyme activation domain-containing protein [Actinomycetota bacterium]